jgi:proteasome lid subunit RPN8/RPN11
MVRIPRRLVEELRQHARDDEQNEVCGVIHARDGEPFEVIRVRNIAGADETPSPFRYNMDTRALIDLEKRRDNTGESLFAIYHSHIKSEARPSPTDENLAFYPPGRYDLAPAYPGTLYILISLTHQPDVRAWRIESREPGAERPKVTEEPIEIV